MGTAAAREGEARPEEEEEEEKEQFCCHLRREKRKEGRRSLLLPPFYAARVTPCRAQREREREKGGKSLNGAPSPSTSPGEERNQRLLFFLFSADGRDAHNKILGKRKVSRNRFSDAGILRGGGFGGLFLEEELSVLLSFRRPPPPSIKDLPRRSKW